MRRLLLLTAVMIVTLSAVGCESCFPRLFRGERAERVAPVYAAPCGAESFDGGCGCATGGCASGGCSGGGCSGGCSAPMVSSGTQLSPIPGPVPGPAPATLAPAAGTPSTFAPTNPGGTIVSPAPVGPLGGGVGP